MANRHYNDYYYYDHSLTGGGFVNFVDIDVHIEKKSLSCCYC